MKYNYLVFILLFFALACKQQKTPEEVMQFEIAKMEENLSQNAMSLNEANGFEMLKKYDLYVQKFPQDTLVPALLFKSGELAMTIKATNKALFYFNKLQNNFPDYKNTPYSVFLQAFLYESQMNDTAKAREYYNLFISKYPNHSLVKDAKASINMLGKDLNEIIKEFEAKNKE